MYISLHNHSHYSTLDGYQTVPEMVSRAKELGYHSLALTDHGTMRGIIDFYEECHRQEIKPIIGCEFYFCETPEIRDRSLTYHLVLLAKNDIGYHNIKLLDSESYREKNFFFNGRLPLDYLREHSEGLICLTACMAGVLNSDKADWWMQTLQEIFPENLYAEIQPLNIPEQQEYNAKVIGLARKYEVPLVVTTDAHYAIKADKEYHSLWTGIKGVQYHDDENYLWSKQEIMETAWIPDNVKDECIANTEEIAKQCNVTIEMGGNHYPDYPVANPANKIREICRGTWKDKVPKGKYKEYAERFESEMVDLEKAGYLNYLLVIWDMLKHCIEKGIPVGEGRGCSISGTKVLLGNGTTKNIEDIVIGDTIISHTGQVRAVTNTMRYEVDESMIRITVEDKNPMTFTCDHKILVYRGGLCNKKESTGYKYCRPSCNKKCKSYPCYEWIPMSELNKGDRVCFPKVTLPKPSTNIIDLMELIPDLVCKGEYVNFFANDTQWEATKVKRYITIDNDLCRVIGFFIGNGWANKRHNSNGYKFGIAFSIKNKQWIDYCDKILREKFNAIGYRDINKNGTCVRYNCNRAVIANFFMKLCGVHAENKHIPDILMVDKPSWIINIINGLMSTDGSVADGRINYDSISYNLICQVKTLWSYLGFNTSIYTRKVTRKNWHTSYKLRVLKTRNMIDDGYMFSEIKNIERIDNFKGYVYDITTDVDHSYIANNTIVHNSAGGSLVGYLMDIHKVDPIVRGTEFFRFCNPYRVSPCDIDTDVSTIHRGEIIEYVRKRYGYICKIMTIGYTKNPEKHEVGKAAVQRAGQALKLEAQALKRLVKGIELDMNEILMSTEFDKETRERLYDVAQHFSYRLHKIGIHASAILVTPDEIENYTPLEGCYSTDVSTGERKYIQAAAYTYHQLEAMGCLKLDILGLGTLDVIDECLRSTGMTMADIPLDDEATYKTYADGNLLGVFQMESSGMTRTAQQLGVSNFNDIAALVALFRPGPIYSGMLQQYIDGKNGKEIEYPCEVVKKLTENTYGVLVYQEQVMKIAMEMAGYTLGQADVLRKVIGRKEVTKIDKAVEEFIMACKEQGYDESIAKPVAEQIRAAGAYIFNKCLSGREYIFRQNAGKEALSIGEMYKICHDKDFAIATGHKPLHGKYRQFGYGKAYSMVGDGIIQNDIIDIRYSGKLPVYVVTTESGKQVRCTMNHKLPTPNGIKLLEELGVGDLLYVDGGYNTKASDYLTKKGTKPRLVETEKIVSIEYECTEDCYDVEMKAPNHNFVVGSGIVVCNSHSVEYAQLSFKTAYLKTHYPVPYMCALINSKSKQEDVQKYIPELNRLAIQLLPPDYSIGNLKWQVEGKAIRIGLNYIKGVGKALKLGATTWEQFITMNNKTVCTALIKAGAMDFLGKDRGWMLANLEDNAKKLAYMEKCKERIEFYTGQGKASGVTMWKKKLADTVMLNDSGKGYDVAKGEMEVLRLTFHTVPKILVGIASAVQEFEDKNKKVMARIIFDTDYGEYKCVVFASQWKQETRRGRYGKIIRGITIEQGKTYEFIQKDGVISDCREYRCKYKQV